jgi:AraC family transcriptional regulator
VTAASSSGRHRREYEHRVNRVIDHIRAHRAEELTLEALSRVAAFSPFHFHRVFKAVTGENLFELVQRIRLEAAAGALVMRPDAEVLAIALDNGFTSASGFARAFRERFGMSATEWRAGGASAWSKARMAKRKPGTAERSGGKAAADAGGHGGPSRRNDDMLNVTVNTLPAVRVAYMRHTGPYGAAGAIPDLWRRLRRWAEPRDLWTAERVCLGIAHDDPRVTDPEKCRYDAAVVLGESRVDDTAVNVATVPAGKFAVAEWRGTASEVDGAWDAIFGWLPGSGYQPDERAALEVYRGDCMDFATGVVRCDICLAVTPL